MNPSKRGQIVKFHTPNKDEDPNQLYLVLEFREDGEKSRVLMQFLNTNFSIIPTMVVYAKDLVVDKLLTKQLARYLEVLEIEGKINQSSLNKIGITSIADLKKCDF